MALVLQAQEDELPERLIAGDPGFFLRWVLGHQSAPGFAFDPDSMEDYLACIADPAVIHGMCEDYRAGWGIDRAIDDQDRGRRIAAPLLVLWGERGNVARAKPLETWRSWADDVRGHALPGGHFVPEEASAGVTEALLAFFG